MMKIGHTIQERIIGIYGRFLLLALGLRLYEHINGIVANPYDNLFCLILLLLCILGLVMSYIDLFKHSFWIFAYKFTFSVLLSLIGIKTSRPIMTIAIFLLLMLVFEMFIIGSTRGKLFLIISLGIESFLIISMQLSFLSWPIPTYFIFFLPLVTIVFVLSYFELYHLRYHGVINNLEMQRRMFEDSKAKNKALRESQRQFRLVNDQLLFQKNQLGNANQDLNKMMAESEVLYQLLLYIVSVLELDKLVEVVVDAVIGTIGVDTCKLIVYNRSNGSYLYSVRSIYSSVQKEQLRQALVDGDFERYRASEKVHLNNHVNIGDYPFLTKDPVASLAIIPLSDKGVNHGLLIVEHSTSGMFTPNNIQFFRSIGKEITLAVNNAYMYNEMKELAIMDPLTKVYNRQYLQSNLDNWLIKAKEKKTPFTLALFDIDHFKGVNDKYGHLFGDEVIQKCALMGKRYAKEYEGHIIRYGGEEFVLTFPDKSLDQVFDIMDLFHKAIKAIEFHYEDMTLHIDISSGITSYPSLAHSSRELLIRADNAMYYSKKHGRGKITLDDQTLEKVI